MSTARWTVIEETLWLARHPEFNQRPATIEEFLGDGYLNIEKGIRPGVRAVLVDIFTTKEHGERIARVERAIYTGGIGVGKTTMASVALLYMVHWVLCLKDPQDYYNLLPGSRIAFMMMSTSEQQAREVIFGDVTARMKHSDWFKNNAEVDKNFTKQIRFSNKDIWIVPGDSRETTFEGYNILGGILDEADSHRQTKEKDYAEDGYDTIINRIKSRYVDNSDPSREGHRGLLVVIGQMKRQGGFAAKKYEEFKEDPYSHATRMTIWESFGWDKYTFKNGRRNSFWYDIKRKMILPKEEGIDYSGSESVIEIPRQYLHEFKNKPEKALKDLAGIPPYSTDPFIAMFHKIEECETRYAESHPDSPGGIINESCVNPKISPGLGFPGSLKRVVHIDLAYSADGDAAAIVMGHVSHLTETEEGDKAPYVVLDAFVRIRARPGTEIMLRDVREYVYLFRKLGFKINKVTLDGFQSIDTMQQFRRRKIPVDYLSVDRSKEPYEDLREAIYEDRLEFPRYLTYKDPGDSSPVDIAMRELLELTDTGSKIDHPRTGSKDIADGCAAVVHTLTKDSRYRRGLSLAPGAGKLKKDGPSLESLLDQFENSSTKQGASAGFNVEIPPGLQAGDGSFQLPPRFYK